MKVLVEHAIAVIPNHAKVRCSWPAISSLVYCTCKWKEKNSTHWPMPSNAKDNAFRIWITRRCSSTLSSLMPTLINKILRLSEQEIQDGDLNWTTIAERVSMINLAKHCFHCVLPRSLLHRERLAQQTNAMLNGKPGFLTIVQLYKSAHYDHIIYGRYSLTRNLRKR